MDKSPVALLLEGASLMGLPMTPELADALWAYATDLLRWNQKVNLTAITRFSEVVEKHLLDSLAVLPEVGAAPSLLDLGAGAGLPGIPLALALPGLKVVLADAVGKKVSFIKNAAVKAGLVGRVRAEHCRAEGHPEQDKLGRAQVVISRALMEVGPWVTLAAPYVEEGGRVVAMLGQMPPQAALEQAAAAAGLKLHGSRTYRLPFSQDPRGVAVFSRLA